MQVNSFMVNPEVINAQPVVNSPKPSENEIRLRRILKSSPQDLWLETLRRAQGTKHDGLIYWMLNQTECDFAVAVNAFYRSNPAQFLDMPRPLLQRPGPSDIFALVLLNWDTGSYRTHQLEVATIDVDSRLIARVRQKAMAHPHGSLPFRIPQRFLEPTGGTPVKLPRHLMPDEAQHLWPLFRDLGLAVDAIPPGIGRKIMRARSLFRRIRRDAQRA